MPEQHVVGLLIGVALDQLIPHRWPRWTIRIGLPLAALGVVVNASAVRSRGAGDLDRPTELVRSGPYAWSRNPMYLGWSLIHLGAALSARSPGMSITWPVSVVLVNRAIGHEERQLAAGFGTEFTSYAAAVPRYLSASSVRILVRSVRAHGRMRPPRSGTTRRA